MSLLVLYASESRAEKRPAGKCECLHRVSNVGPARIARQEWYIHQYQITAMWEPTGYSVHKHILARVDATWHGSFSDWRCC